MHRPRLVPPTPRESLPDKSRARSSSGPAANLLLPPGPEISLASPTHAAARNPPPSSPRAPPVLHRRQSPGARIPAQAPPKSRAPGFDLRFLFPSTRPPPWYKASLISLVERRDPQCPYEKT